MVTSAEEYTRQLRIRDMAGIRVVLTRTREPERCVSILKCFAAGEFGDNEDKKDIGIWQCNEGWRVIKTSRAINSQFQVPEEPPDGHWDLISALEHFTNNIPENRINVLFHPHFFIRSGNEPDPRVIQLLYTAKVKLNSNLTNMLVLVCPIGFNLPVELDDQIDIVDLESPTEDEYYQRYVDYLSVSVDPSAHPKFTEDNIREIARLCSGMTLHEFETSVSCVLASCENAAKIEFDDFREEMMIRKIEMVKKSEVLECMPPESMEDVGGLDLIKSWAAERAFAMTPEAREYGVDRVKGLLLVGPPGGGKSLIAKALANEMKMPLIRFDVSRVFASYVGQSEQRTDQALKMLSDLAPCVALIDEGDKVFGDSGGDGGDRVGRRVLGKILTWMQELKRDVFVVMTINRIEGMPPELLRKGRLDEIFSVALPQDSERMEILKIHLRKRKHDPDSIRGLVVAVKASDGYSAAEIESAVNETILKSFIRDKAMITGESIVEQLKTIRPMSIAFKDQISKMKKWSEENARPSSTPEGQDKPPVAKMVRKTKIKKEED